MLMEKKVNLVSKQKNAPFVALWQLPSNSLSVGIGAF